MRRVAPLAVLLAALALPAVSAEPTPKQVYDVRHDLFEDLGRSMKASSTLLKAKDAKAADLLKHAEGIHANALKIATIFPEGTGKEVVPQTRALAAVWQDRAGFDAAAQALVEASAKLVEAGKSGDVAAFKAQFGAVGKACGSCHEKFREEKE